MSHLSVASMRLCDGLCLVCGRVVEPFDACIHDYYPKEADEVSRDIQRMRAEMWSQFAPDTTL